MRKPLIFTLLLVADDFPVFIRVIRGLPFFIRVIRGKNLRVPWTRIAGMARSYRSNQWVLFDFPRIRCYIFESASPTKPVGAPTSGSLPKPRLTHPSGTLRHTTV